jgi:hypothetical protein
VAGHFAFFRSPVPPFQSILGPGSFRSPSQPCSPTPSPSGEDAVHRTPNPYGGKERGDGHQQSCTAPETGPHTDGSGARPSSNPALSTWDRGSPRMGCLFVMARSENCKVFVRPGADNAQGKRPARLPRSRNHAVAAKQFAREGAKSAKKDPARALVHFLSFVTSWFKSDDHGHHRRSR